LCVRGKGRRILARVPDRSARAAGPTLRCAARAARAAPRGATRAARGSVRAPVRGTPRTAWSG
jgi:hypothetical protein